jgi:C1A family cysteine protease
MARTALKPRLNCRPSHRDFRDLKYSMVETSAMGMTYPHTGDIRKIMPPVMDQSTIGSCSMNSLSACVDHLELLELRMGLPLDQAPQEYAKYYEPVSRLFGYWNERSLEGTTSSDAGATTLRDGCVAFQKWGACKESTWPYHVSQVLVEPPPAAYGEAASHKISNFYALQNLQDMKKCIFNGYPHVLGFTVYESFMDESWWASGMMPVPSPYEQVEGGHAVVCVGYDDSKQCALIRNSWGLTFGIEGHFWMPYSVMFNPEISGDFWTLRRVPTVMLQKAAPVAKAA